MPTFRETLATELSEFHRAPFLFVGSGVSRRYIKAENWKDLLRNFCSIIDVNYNKLTSGANGDLPATASALADIFFERWWQDDAFEASRALYKNPTKRESCLRIEIPEYLKELTKAEIETEVLQKEVELFSDVVIDGIITTNYDSFLERVFPDFVPYIGQGDLLFSDPQGVVEIYKIHVSCTKSDSLVSNYADYQYFNERNPCLAAKLLTIFTQHPVIILGYSLGDSNVQAILESIASCLDEDGLQKLANRLVMVHWKLGASEATLTNGHTFSFHGRTIPYRKIECPDYVELFEVLGGIERKWSPKLLRPSDSVSLSLLRHQA